MDKHTVDTPREGAWPAGSLPTPRRGHPTHDEQDKLMRRQRALGTAGYSREDARSVNARVK